MSVKKITVTALETALKEIMRQTPFEKITVSDITNRCQLNRQTFYYHFADKYALLGQIYKQEIFDPFTDGLTFENWNTHLLQMFETMAADAALYKNAVLHADDEFRRFLFQSAATLFRDAVAKLNLRSGLQVSEEEQHFIADFFCLRHYRHGAGLGARRNAQDPGPVGGAAASLGYRLPKGGGRAGQRYAVTIA